MQTVGKISFLISLASLFLTGCQDAGSEHFITDRAYRNQVQEDLSARKEMLAPAPENIFIIFFSNMTPAEREALGFLYAYSPLEDLTAFDGDFWLSTVRQTFRTREEMPWGKQIPEDIFRHYVLPLRINNEALDSARFVFHDELAPRVQHCKTMEEAALAVNHWCHEKATYQPTDARTCSPTTMISRTYGRCGEESVFTAAALRSVGIPARQIYTPRWAHCDDNHAWIEVWADGEWKFLGACEPEPALNMAWFTFPASRGLFMQTRVFGRYNGTEEVVNSTPLITYINATATYTDTGKPVVKVTDQNGKTVPGALVEYKVYNYAEYYTVASKTTDEKGEASLTMGQGDWVLWVSANVTGRPLFGFKKVNPAGKDTIRITLDKPENELYSNLFEITPPAGKAIALTVDEQARAKNDLLLNREDSIRAAFSTTFYTKEPATSLDTYLKTAMGNYPQIEQFIQAVQPDTFNKNTRSSSAATALLGAITSKDLQDVAASVLLSHLTESRPFIQDPGENMPEEAFAFNIQYIASPRIKTETLTAWRPAIKKWLAENKATDIPSLLTAMEKIKVHPATGRGDVLMAPDRVLRTGVTESSSKDVFFVAACRTMGIPSRLNPTDSKPQYYQGTWPDGAWITLSTQKQNDTATHSNGYLTLTSTGGAVPDPVYYIHFTVSRLENGVAKLMELGDASEGDMGAGMKCSTIFKQPVELEPGNYILVTGNRKSDGSVVSTIRSFHIEKGKITRENLEVPPVNESFKPVGNVSGSLQGIDLPKKGYTVIAAISAHSEPVNHLLRDFSAMAADFEKRPVKITFLFKSREELDKFTASNTKKLPHNIVYKIDEPMPSGKTRVETITGQLSLPRPDHFPLIIVANAKEEVVYVAQGYLIGAGYQIMKYLP